ncbi:MAG: hypothetical protein H0V24_11535 [Chloroflexia bacterium]|nr:hypothetical protein [Chloroflexia bacterium]
MSPDRPVAIENPWEGVVRVLGLGMPCAESVAAMSAMLRAGANLVGIVAARAAPPAAGVEPGAGSSLDSLASAHGLPVIAVSRLNAEVTAAMRRLRPEVIVVACFPWRLPADLLAMPLLGCFNLHPSLLPRGRGPDPVFWTYRRGERDTGVTVHLMNAGLDTGPILGQHRVAVPAGSRAPDLERTLMARGGQLVAELLPPFAAGTIRLVAQDDALATTAPIPAAHDYVISATMPAAAAYAFARAVAPRHGPLMVSNESTGDRLRIDDAIDYATDDPVVSDYSDEGKGIVRVRFGPGWVRFLRAGAGRYPLSLSPTRARDIR